MGGGGFRLAVIPELLRCAVPLTSQLQDDLHFVAWSVLHFLYEG